MKLYHYIFVLTLLYSCQGSSDSNKTTDVNEVDHSQTTTFDYENFTIQPGQLGDIKIGMTMDEAEGHFSGLEKMDFDASYYGIDGGGSAFEYRNGNEPVFTLIPQRDGETILYIIAISPKLSTSTGLHPNSTAAQIQEVYPEVKVHKNYMTGWEGIPVSNDQLEFVFTTNEETIGEYPDHDESSEILNSSIKADWVMIR